MASSPLQLKVRLLNESAILPTYAHSGDVGLDLFCVDPVTIPPGEIQLVNTGIAIELPAGTEGQIRPRSGLALQGVTVLNSPGTVDTGYRGELKVLLINHGRQAFSAPIGTRVAQLVVAPVAVVSVEIADELRPSQRAERGFGSSGR